MYKNIFLIAILTQLILGCSLKKDEILFSQQCPKHLIVGDSKSKIFNNNSFLTMMNVTQLNCYNLKKSLDFVNIDITHLYSIESMPINKKFMDYFELVVLVTDREETKRLFYDEFIIPLNNVTNANNMKTGPIYVDSLKTTSFTNIQINYEDYKSGLRIFSAIK